MPSSAGKIRNVERDDSNPRPRDRAIREAANDNRRFYTVLNNTPTQNPNNPTVDQQFSDSYNLQGLQPSVGRVSSPTRNVSVTTSQSNSRTAGRVLQAAGIAAQVPEKGRRLTGIAMEEAGKRLEARTTNTNDPKRLQRRPPQVVTRRKGKLQKIKVASLVKSKIRVTRVSVMIISAAASMYTMIQFPAAIIATVFLGLMYMVGYFQSAIKGVVGETLYSWGEYVFGGVVEIVGKILGFDLLAVINPATFFVLAYLVTILIGIATLIGAVVVYQVSLVNCLGGKQAGKKMTAFVIALAFYMIPVLNIFPWGLYWMFVVWKHPE